MPARTKILIAVLVLIGLGAGAFVVYDQNIKRQQRLASKPSVIGIIMATVCALSAFCFNRII